jgi:leucyl aminopeptidase (aminopeptidase T)
MNTGELMTAAALNAMNNVMNLISSDRILILTDIHCKNIAESFKQAGLKKGCEVEIYQLNESMRPIKEIPNDLLPLLSNKTIVLNIIKAFAEEIQFRIKWLFIVEENKSIRCAHMPGVTESMMTEGPFNVDYYEMKTKADLLIDLFKNAEYIHITTEEGTNLMLGIKERKFTNDVFIKSGQMSNLPCGEIYCAPEETRADGVILFNASIGDIGLLKNPLKVILENGKIKKFESTDNELVKKIIELTNVDEYAKVIGELGIGINPGARITGNMLEDEKAIGTAHIAFGNNEDFPGGGKNMSKIHRDYLFYRPTIEAIYKNKTSRIVINNGEFLLKG